MGSMNIFKSFTLKWWQTGLFKWSMLALGILVGATWPDVFHAWRTVLLLVFALPGIYITWIWWKQ
jgi:hypothetical protein